MMNALGESTRLYAATAGHSLPTPRKTIVFNYLLFAGIWIRLLVFLVLDPFNNDSPGHYEHVLYIKNHGSLPSSGLGHETYQPPLYYLLAAAMSAISANTKFIQIFSLLTSIATLFVARRVICYGTFLTTEEGKQFAFLVVCLLPQFVMFSLYLSNDSLAILLGFLAFHKAEQLLAHATTQNFLGLVVVLMLGLLTKGQFLVISVVLLPWGWLRYWSGKARTFRQTVLPCMLALVLLALGCAKYVQNTIQYGKPFISSMNFNPAWLESQQGTYIGLDSIIDVNVFKLLRLPTLDETTLHSIPLLLYGTFWYQYIPESNFRGNRLPGASYIGRYLHLVGVAPVIVLIIGALAIPFNLPQWLRLKPPGFLWATLLRLSVPVAFAGIIAMLAVQFSFYDNWSMFQARLLFPTLLGGFVLFDIGAGEVGQWIQFDRAFTVWQFAFLIGVGGYFAVELYLQLARVN